MEEVSGRAGVDVGGNALRRRSKGGRQGGREWKERISRAATLADTFPGRDGDGKGSGRSGQWGEVSVFLAPRRCPYLLTSPLSGDHAHAR